VITIKVINKM